MAIPSAPSTRQIAFIANAKIMFSLTISSVLFDIFIANAIFAGSSSISTTSAASIAASEPRAPIATPISALDNTGASLIPSPTNARASLSPFSASNFSTCSTLSPGRSSLLTMSMPISVATLSATFLESPVNITVFFIPFFFNSAIAIFVVGLIISEIVMQPAYTPSTAT